MLNVLAVKSDSSLLFRRLNELNTCHRVIMTGVMHNFQNIMHDDFTDVLVQTPLNNNIRELFNLMNFLDPNEWNDLEGLAKEFEDLDEERVKDLHERLRPYFLRRVKAEVLKLPPKVRALSIVFINNLTIIRTKSLSRYLWHLSKKRFISQFLVSYIH